MEILLQTSYGNTLMSVGHLQDPFFSAVAAIFSGNREKMFLKTKRGVDRAVICIQRGK